MFVDPKPVIIGSRNNSNISNNNSDDDKYMFLVRRLGVHLDHLKLCE
jgi:hypothetical protein